MPDQKTAEVVRRTHESQAIARAALTEGFNAAGDGLRTMLREVHEVQWDLARVDNVIDRQEGLEELNQKLGAFVREANKLLDQMGRVANIATEIERETPRIAEQLGVELGSDE